MLKVGILFGGKSGEHDVSKCSAASVYKALDKSKYEVTAIAIDKDGRWYPQKSATIVNDPDFGSILSFEKKGEWYTNQFSNGKGLTLVNIEDGEKVSVDVVFPVIHGTFCEDGTIQGLLELADVPYVGPEVLGSAVGMDKDVTKRILKEGGIPVVPWITLLKHKWMSDKNGYIKQIESEIGYPFFAKPANAGSSVGINKVKSREKALEFIDYAFKFDNKILIEQSVDCREIECAVLGNADPKASVLGEIIPKHEFYSYEAKYIDKNGAVALIPANVDEPLSSEIRDNAVKTFELLCLKGLARVDFFLDKSSNKYYLNEVNTLPGFTSISMYPKLWEATGLKYNELLDRLIELAMDNKNTKKDICY